jgi:hypothetical protein
MLEDMGKDIFLKVGSQTWIHWINVRQLTPQSASNIPNPGNSPPNTIGYVPAFVSFGENNPAPSIFDDVNVVRVG